MAADFPLFVLPGIMGTRLLFTRTGKQWDPDDMKEMWWDWYHVFPRDNRADLHFKLQTAVVQYDPEDDVLTSAQKARGWGGPAWTYYGELLRDLEARHPNAPVWAVGYDWRKPIEETGKTVGGKIVSVLRALGKDEFGVIMHSMGGLVMRSAFITFQELLPKARIAIFICPPSVGSPLMYRRLFTGATAELDGSGFGDHFFRNIIGNTREYFSANASVLPGAIQLLPSKHYPKTGNNPWHSDLNNTTHDKLYPAAVSPPGISPRNQDWPPSVLRDLSARAVEVNSFHEHLGKPNENLPTNSFLIHGTGLLTDVAVSNNRGTLNPDQKKLGDATVPTVSATELGLDPHRVVNIPCLEHGTACQEWKVISAVRELLA